MWKKLLQWLFNTKTPPATQEPCDHSQDNVEIDNSSLKGPSLVEKQETQMTPVRPYLLKAFYDWIIANNCTPHIHILTHFKGVQVPSQFQDQDQSVVFNVSPVATRDFQINNHAISFRATFSGEQHELYIPIEAITSIFAQEHHRGMIFEEEDFSQPGYNESKKATTSFKPKLVVHNEKNEVND